MSRNTAQPPRPSTTTPAGLFCGALTPACTGLSPGSTRHQVPSSPRRARPNSPPACSTPNSPPARTCPARQEQPALPSSQPREMTMPDTMPGMTGDDAANLTALLGEFGGLWQISRTSHGYTAQRRPPPAPPLVLTAKTVRALRQLLQHGYDAGKLAAIMADFGGQWEVEHLDPGPALAGASHEGSHTQRMAADTLDSLRTPLTMTSTDHTPVQ